LADAAADDIAGTRQVLHSIASVRPNLRDENDNMVFECAANFGARIIVTHNIRDFRGGELCAYGIEPVEPGAFLRMLEE
jgi:hypothetical protein